MKNLKEIKKWLKDNKAPYNLLTKQEAILKYGFEAEDIGEFMLIHKIEENSFSFETLDELVDEIKKFQEPEQIGYFKDEIETFKTMEGFAKEVFDKLDIEIEITKTKYEDDFYVKYLFDGLHIYYESKTEIKKIFIKAFGEK